MINVHTVFRFNYNFNPLDFQIVRLYPLNGGFNPLAERDKLSLCTLTYSPI